MNNLVSKIALLWAQIMGVAMLGLITGSGIVSSWITAVPLLLFLVTIPITVYWREIKLLKDSLNDRN